MVPSSKVIHCAPKNMDNVNEIMRRAELYNTVPLPRARNWNRVQTMEWLQKNPIRDHADIEFLTNEMLRVEDVLIRKARGQQEMNAGGRGHWRGSVPYLRLIMCLTQDNVKCLFLTRANSRSRQELDARNSDRRPPTVFELIAELWNSSDFNPVAPPSDCHFDFQMATPCSHDLVAGMTPATPQKIEDTLTLMRVRVLRIISRWEQSGQGEGGTDIQDEELPDHVNVEANDDDDSHAASSLGNDRRQRSPSSSSSPLTVWGGLSGRPARALQSRSAFLNGEPSYLLYFWEVINSHQLLQSSLQRLSNNVGAADGIVPTTANSSASGGSVPRHRRDRQQHQNEMSMMEASISPLAKSLHDLANSHVQLAMQREEDRVHEQRMEDQRRQSEASAECRKRSFERRSQLLDQARQYRRLNAELNPNNENSQRLSNFYLEECEILQKEIDALDDNNNNSSTYE